MDEHSVRDGNRVLRFRGIEVCSVSSERPGSARWSELSVYRLEGAGGWLLQRVGRSSVAHRPECRFVSRRMVSWLEAREEGRFRRTPCVECQPAVGDAMDPHTRLEVQRYSVYQAANAAGIAEILLDGREMSDVPALVREAVRRVTMAT